MSKTHRRQFIQSSAITISGFAIMSSQTALTASTNSQMAVGLIGCGGRGNNDAGNFQRYTNSRIVALADPYEDRLASTKKRFADDSPDTYQGFDAYQKVLDSDVDTVIITSPPYFHPQHFSAAVQAGKHIYLEKPVAVDTVGCHKILEAGKQGAGKKTMMVGFQGRYNPHLRGSVEQVHKGAIGEIVCGQAHYHSGWLAPRHKPGMSEQEKKIRNWVFHIDLSGDILVEQNIHVLDMCNWVMQSTPEKAYGTGGRKIRTLVGDTWDHYAVTFWYPGEVELAFNSTQFLKLGWGDAGERFNGSKGAFDALCGHGHIRGENEWHYEGEDRNDEELKVKAFCGSVVSGEYINEVPQGVSSTLTAILGRTASYKGTEYTWKQMIADNEEYDAHLNL